MANELADVIVLPAADIALVEDKSVLMLVFVGSVELGREFVQLSSLISWKSVLMKLVPQAFCEGFGRDRVMGP